ncbi:IclR family transcriptional regulator [Aeromicrobium piscarium]|nr:IclR family transcriptional regulator [Aeromicrobium piscarium]
MVETNGTGETVEGPYAQTLGRGIEVLELLAARPRSARAVGDALGLNRSTAYRLVQTLLAHGLIQRDGLDDKVYRLTPRLWELGVGTLAPSEIRMAAGREVRALADKYGESVHLAIYHDREAVYIDKADGWQPIGSYTRLGGRAPAYCVATGKALLAYQTSDEVQNVIEAGLEPHTPTTVSQGERLMEALTEIRSQGFAVNRGEWRSDVSGMAVPLFDANMLPVAALGFSGPTERTLARQDELLPALQEAALRIAGHPS